MPLHTIGKLLHTTDELKALHTRVRRLSELQILYLRSAPRELASASRVKNYRAGILCIAADNAAVAAKLNQLKPRLLESIQKIEADVTSMRVEVQVSNGHRAHESKKSTLPAAAIEKFDALAQRIGSAQLKSALGHLVKRHKRSR